MFISLGYTPAMDIDYTAMADELTSIFKVGGKTLGMGSIKALRDAATKGLKPSRYKAMSEPKTPPTGIDPIPAANRLNSNLVGRPVR